MVIAAIPLALGLYSSSVALCGSHRPVPGATGQVGSGLYGVEKHLRADRVCAGRLCWSPSRSLALGKKLPEEPGTCKSIFHQHDHRLERPLQEQAQSTETGRDYIHQFIDIVINFSLRS